MQIIFNDRKTIECENILGNLQIRSFLQIRILCFCEGYLLLYLNIWCPRIVIFEWGAVI